MTETSFFWDGLVTGDAVLAPYTHNIWHTLWQIMFSRANNEGVLNNIDNELAVSGVTGGVSVATGKALVDGSLYETDATISVTIPTPTTDPRIDRIVLSKDWVLQTIRVARVAGTENASPTAPALTQTAGTLWETPLAQALITTAGAITVTDERENARTRLAPVSNMEEIETFVGDGIVTSINFSSIPSTFKHLLLVGNLSIDTLTLAGASCYLNGDTNLANYNRHLIIRNGGVVAAAGNAGGTALLNVGGAGVTRDATEKTVSEKIFFANYKNTTFYKTAIAHEMEIPNETTNDFRITVESGLWKNTEAIHTINIIAADIITDETILTLYGLS